jgi:hypothetical protein
MELDTNKKKKKKKTVLFGPWPFFQQGLLVVKKLP